MPDVRTHKTFTESLDAHLLKARQFRKAAHEELSNIHADSLHFREAFAAAVEATKHALKAYLWSRIEARYPRDPSGRWQEIAVGNNMPELVDAARQAGLPLSDEEAWTIKRYNADRNRFMHDSPQYGRQITREAAQGAYELAAKVARRTQLDPSVPLPSGASPGASPRPQPSATRAQPAGETKPRQGVVSTTTPAPTPASATAQEQREPSRSAGQDASQPRDDAAEEPDEDDIADDTDLAVPIPSRARRRWRMWAALAAAAALIVGLLGGIALTYPVASGQVALPTWVPFADQLAPATPTVLPTATATVYTGPRVAGNLLITPSACGVAGPSVTLLNTGAAAITWAASSPDTLGVSFAAGASGTPRPILTGQLAPNASVTLLVSGLPAGQHVLVIADGGTVEFTLPAC